MIPFLKSSDSPASPHPLSQSEFGIADLAETSGLGYAQSALVFGALIAMVMAGFYYLRLNAVLAFWLAYILTRPLGASIGDLLSQPTKVGGLGWGTTGTSVVFLCIIASLVVYLSFKRRKPALSTDQQD